ncbi:MAG TPA: hypothetical protein VFM98_17550 [Ramlibacter sp.]|uniref:hypothetical protein n=1 Tax=Ramlibacter sp. TaxID=1917967 RepID=UPI002D80EE95|nr:hypothetical protein [Ramlibacter sp.]HET8747409.1 hypothetical protein [Ramlibacter sp.]
MKLPSDRRILECIFDRYAGEFENFELEKTRSSKIYVPVDCKAVAATLKTNPDIVFGRLYYHLEKRYGYVQADGSKVHLFALKVGNDSKCVNFPLLASVLAGLQEERTRHLVPQAIAIAALVVSIASIAVSLWAAKP